MSPDPGFEHEPGLDHEPGSVHKSNFDHEPGYGHEPGFARLLVERGFELLHEEEAGDAASLRLVELGARARARANDA